MDQTIKYLIKSFCSISKIPYCLRELIRVYLIKYAKLKLFNYKYLGFNTDDADIYWLDYWGYYIHVMTSILTGFVLDYPIFLKFRIQVGKSVYIDIFLNQSIYKTNANEDKDIHFITTKSLQKWIYCKQQITVWIFMKRSTDCHCHQHHHDNIIQIVIMNNESKINLCENMNFWSNEVNHQWGIATIKLDKNFEYETNQDVTIQYEMNCDYNIRKCKNESSLIPINDCARGWICCQHPFKT